MLVIIGLQSNRHLNGISLASWWWLAFTVEFWSSLPSSTIRNKKRWCIDKLGVFHATQKSICLGPHLNSGWGLRSENSLSPPVKYFHRPFQVVDQLCYLCLVFVILCVCSLLPCGHLLGKGWPLGSRLWCLIAFLSLSYVVSWVWCGAWLYRFLIFATFLTLLTCCLLLLPLWDSVIVLCFVVRFFMSLLVLQSSWWGRENWLLCLVCLPGISWLLCGSSSRCYGLVCRLW